MPTAFVSWSTEVFFIPSVTAHRLVSFSNALRSCSVSYSVKAKISPFHLWPLWSFRSYYALFPFFMQVLFLQALFYQVLSWAFPGLFLIFPGDFSGIFQVMPGFSASHCIFIMLFYAADNMKWPHICSIADSPLYYVWSNHSKMVYRIQKEVTNE